MSTLIHAMYGGTQLLLDLTDIASGQYTYIELANGSCYVFDWEVLVDCDADVVMATFAMQFYNSPPQTVIINVFLGMSGTGKSILFN